jgi:hypothetical protein
MPKFFPIIPLPGDADTQDNWLPPAPAAGDTDVEKGSNRSRLLPAPPPAASKLPADQIPLRQPPLPEPYLDCNPQAAPAAHVVAGQTAEHGHAFLSWLADQITGQAVPKPHLCAARARQHAAPGFDFSADDEYDPHIDYELDDKSLLSSGTPNWGFALPEGLESAFEHDHDADEEIYEPASAHLIRGKETPRIEIAADGGRLEKFAAGSMVIKDVLGRVVEVRSQFGECLSFRYGVFGKLESFQRTDRQGHAHSEGKKDKHGVVVRDHEGRVRAAGESMAVDPHGCFYLHSTDGQYFSLDLVTGLHSERRRVFDHHGCARFITSLFTHDGFRMATMFAPAFSADGTICGASQSAPFFRFYGRDGTMIEFASPEDLQELRPHRVSVPGARPLHKSWLRRRQANTAWDSVHDYLVRVS